MSTKEGIKPRDWETKAATARIIGKTERTVERLITAKILKTLPKIPGMQSVRVIRSSIEEYLGHEIEPEAIRPVITIDQDHYEALRLQLTRKDIQIKEMSLKLIVWEGEKESHTAELEKGRADLKKIEEAKAAILIELEEGRVAASELELEKAAIQTELKQARAQVAEIEQSKAEYEAELKAVKSRGLWARVFNK